MKSREHKINKTLLEDTEAHLKKIFNGLDPKAKLAVVALMSLHCLEGINLKPQLREEIEKDLNAAGIESAFKNCKDPEIAWLLGFHHACEFIVDNT